MDVAATPRWRRPLVAGGAVAALLLGSVSCGTAEPADPTSSPAATGPTVGSAPVDRGALLGELRESAAPADVSLEAVVLGRDGDVLLATPEADRAVPGASLVKLLVVQQLLARSEAGPGGPDAATRDRMEQAITRSDNEAMNALWVEQDGPALVRQAAEDFGLSAIQPPEDPGQWGDVPTSATDMARFLGAVAADPGAPGSATLLQWMRATTAEAADGFDQQFGLLSGAAGPEVAVKQGWACCLDGRRQLHSVGVLADDRVVVLLTDSPEEVPYPRVRSVLDEAAAALVAGAS